MNIDQKGTQVNHTTRSARTPSLRTGIFAALRGVFSGGGGSGAGSLGGGRTPLPGLVSLSVVVAMALLMLTASPASAKVVHPYESQITEAAGAGFCTGSIATDSTADLYLGDNCHGALDKLDSTGSTVTSWGTNGQIAEVNGSHLSAPIGLAVDSSDNLWLADNGLGAVYKLSPTGSFEAQAEGPEAGGAFPFGGAFISGLAWSDAANRLFVADSGSEVLWGIEPDGSYSGTSFSAPGCCSTQVAADNSVSEGAGDLYVSSPGGVRRIHASGTEAGEPHAFSLSAPYIEAGLLTGTPAAPFGEIVGLAVDSAGDLYVAQRQEVDEFAPSGKYLGRITGTPTGPGGEFEPFSQVNNVAVGSTSGNLYVGEASAVDVFDATGLTLPDVATQPGEVHTVTSATLKGEVNPLEIELEECFFEYGETIAYGEVAECEPEAGSLGEGNSFVPVEAQLENLNPGATYHYRLVAGNANGQNNESADQVFFTGATVDATTASEVTATTAKLETEINPRGLATTYSFQYGPTITYGSETPMPPAPLGAGTADVTRAAFLSGLQPATTYHFRVLATDALGTTEGPDRTFTTQPTTASTGLPDNRGWELVSPPDKQGVPLVPIKREGGLIQAAADGDAITYFGQGSIVSEPAGDRSSVNSQDLSTRTGAGWTTADITTPHQAPVGAFPGYDSEYQLFSTDLSLGAVVPFGATPLSPQATEKTPYLRQSDGTYNPLVTESNVPPGTAFGGTEMAPEQFEGGVSFITATPDLSHLLLESPTSLVSGFPNFGGTNGIYEWSDGALTPVSFVPPGTETLCGGSATACEPSGGASGSNTLNRQLRNAISADGSRVFFTARSLDLRDLPRGETLRLDAAQGVTEPEFAGATFQFASTDGTRVFFTDTGRLTPGSTAASGKPDLYMCQVEETPAGLACDLTDLTANTINPAEPAAVQGAVIGAAGDGSSVYFVADGALTTGADSGSCGKAVGDSCNLYRYDIATDETQLIAVLSGADYPDWGGEKTGGNQGLTARVSPNGRFLAFMSERPLTGYDNRDAASGERDEEVFLYDAAADRLLCASCNPTGARPAGRQGPPNVPYALVDGEPNWQSRWYAANVPGWTNIDNLHALYQSRYLSDSGRLFFNAADALVPADANGTEDVYQYEPPGVGSCSEPDPSFAPRNGGCLALISSGTSKEESAFMDASESGDDVFFLTAARLNPARDEDKALDLYDARVGGGEAPPIKPVECSGDACQQPAVPPAHPTPGTLLVNGPENVKQCPKGKKLQKGKCAAKHKAKTHHKKSNKKKGKKQKSQRTASHKGGGSK